MSIKKHSWRLKLTFWTIISGIILIGLDWYFEDDKVQFDTHRQLMADNDQALKDVSANTYTLQMLKKTHLKKISFDSDNQGGGNRYYYMGTIAGHKASFLSKKTTQWLPASVAHYQVINIQIYKINH